MMRSGKGKNVFPVYSMNEQGELYIKLLTETLLYRTITMDYYGYYYD